MFFIQLFVCQNVTSYKIHFFSFISRSFSVFFSFSVSSFLLFLSARTQHPHLETLAKYVLAKIPPALAWVQTTWQSRKHTHSQTHMNTTSVHKHAGLQISMHARRDTNVHTSSLHDPLLVCGPSVLSFRRTNTPDSTEEPLSPFHCSLNSTIESTRWRDKLEQKLNAPRGELEIENHCSCPKPFFLESEDCISSPLPSNKIQ